MIVSTRLLPRFSAEGGERTDFINELETDFNQSICLASHCDPLKSRRITVWMKPEGGLSACIDHLAFTRGGMDAQENIPLLGIPKEIAHETNLAKLLSYFRLTHLVPEKGLDGTINRISVHISGKGGVKAVIPFQPGLALGSVIRGDTLEKMEAYAQIEGNIQDLEEQYHSIESEIQALETKIEARKIQNNASEASKKLASKKLLDVYDKKNTRLLATLDSISKQILAAKNAQLNSPKVYFTKFEQGVMSPVDIANSKIEVQIRGFDSMNFSSTYIRQGTTHEEIKEKIANSSNAQNLSAGGGKATIQANANHSRAAAAAQRVVDILANDKNEGVLILNAFVTTRQVRTFTEIKYDLERLKKIDHIMDKGTPTEQQQYGITKSDKENRIYILTEAVLGGSFTALVTFLNQSEMSRHSRLDEHQNSTNTIFSLNANVAIPAQSSTAPQSSEDESDELIDGWFSEKLIINALSKIKEFGVKTAFSHATNSGNRSEEDSAYSLSLTQINIEFISQGVLPKFIREEVNLELLKRLDLNPSAYELSAEDEAAAGAIAEGDKVAMMERQMKLTNARFSVQQACRGLRKTYEKRKMHTIDSVISAFENFAEKITKDPGCGVPVGFYYEILTQSHIKKQIAMLEKKEN